MSTISDLEQRLFSMLLRKEQLSKELAACNANIDALTNAYAGAQQFKVEMEKAQKAEGAD